MFTNILADPAIKSSPARHNKDTDDVLQRLETHRDALSAEETDPAVEILKLKQMVLALADARKEDSASFSKDISRMRAEMRSLNGQEVIREPSTPAANGRAMSIASVNSFVSHEELDAALKRETHTREATV